MSEAIEIVEPSQALALAEQRPTNVMELLQTAIKSGVPVEALDRLVALQERVMDRQAAIAFAAAKAAFQGEVDPIQPDKHVVEKSKSGAVRKRDYASLGHIAATIAPLLGKNHLSYSFDEEFSDSHVEVTCILSHAEGHSARNKFRVPIDRAAFMNDPQKIASASSFARRYALRDALGLTISEHTNGREEDDDGSASGAVKISDDQAAHIKGLLKDSGADVKRFLAYMRVATVEDIPVSAYDTAVKALEQVKRRRDHAGA